MTRKIFCLFAAMFFYASLGFAYDCTQLLGEWEVFLSNDNATIPAFMVFDEAEPEFAFGEVLHGEV